MSADRCVATSHTCHTADLAFARTASRHLIHTETGVLLFHVQTAEGFFLHGGFFRSGWAIGCVFDPYLCPVHACLSWRNLSPFGKAKEVITSLKGGRESVKVKFVVSTPLYGTRSNGVPSYCARQSTTTVEMGPDRYRVDLLVRRQHRPNPSKWSCVNRG